MLFRSIQRLVPRIVIGSKPWLASYIPEFVLTAGDDKLYIEQYEAYVVTSY